MAIAPLQIPGYSQAPDINWTSLSDLGKTLGENRLNNARNEAMSLAKLGDGSLDFNKAATSLARLGDYQGAQYLKSVGDRQQDLARQGRLDERQLRRDDVTDAQNAAYLKIAQANAARAAEDKYSVQKIEDPNTGAVSFVRINTRGPEGVVKTGAPAPSQPNNPFSAGGKFNEGQGKAAGFTDRMLQSEGILSGINGQGGVQDQGAGFGGVWGGTMEAAGNAPYIGGALGGFANKLKSTDRQKYEQAKRDFVNAQLRRESGAAISESEFDSANKQYFPTVGDSQEVIAQKAANRRAAIEAMGREGGPSYRPKFNFDQQGRVVPYGRQEQTASSPSPQTLKPQSKMPRPAPPQGAIQNGYRFKGGNPADPNSWEPVT